MCRLQLPSRVPRRVNRINKHRGLTIMLCMNPRRQPWSSSSRNNNDIQNIIIFQLIMHDCVMLLTSLQQSCHMLTIECKTSSVIQNTGLLYSCPGRALSDPDVRVIYQCLIAAVHQLPWMQGSYQWDQHIPLLRFILQYAR